MDGWLSGSHQAYLRRRIKFLERGSVFVPKGCIQSLPGSKPVCSKSDAAESLIVRHFKSRGGHQVDCSVTAGQLLMCAAESKVPHLILTCHQRSTVILCLSSNGRSAVQNGGFSNHPSAALAMALLIRPAHKLSDEQAVSFLDSTGAEEPGGWWGNSSGTFTNSSAVRQPTEGIGPKTCPV